MIRKTLIALALLPLPLMAGTLIDDFSDPKATRWTFVTDQVMGGVSDGQVTFTDQGLRLTGTVSTANNGGFLQARRPLTVTDRATGLRLTLRGNGANYYIHLRTSGTMLPWQFYQARIASTASWQTVDVPFTAFKPSGRLLRNALVPSTIKSLGMVAYGADYEADLEVSRIELITP